MSPRSISADREVALDAAPYVGGPSFTLNGEDVSLHDVDPHESLLDLVRRNG
jgi:hypothetical protein